MNQQDNSAFDDQSDRTKQKESNQNPNTVVWDGGSYSNKPTTEADVAKHDHHHGDHGITTMDPTNDSSDEANDYNRDDDEDFDDTVGEDNIADKDGFNANSDDPTERELTKTWIGNEKTVHEAGSKGMEGEPMGGQNFGMSELEYQNDRDASDSEHHNLGWGNSSLNQPSEELSNPPEIEEGGEHPDYKKTID